MPSVPAGCIKIAHVLVLGGATEIRDQYINALWEPRKLTSVVWSLTSGTGTIDGDGRFEWNPTNDKSNCHVIASFLCQYGWAYQVNDTMTFTKLLGIGRIYSDGSGWVDDEAKQTINRTSYSFGYEGTRPAVKDHRLYFLKP